MISSKQRQALVGIIEELDTGMRKQFTEKFAQIQTEFDKAFKELFGGGKGTLELVEDEDILECRHPYHCTAAGQETAEYDPVIRWRKSTDSDRTVICNTELKTITVLSVR